MTINYANYERLPSHMQASARRYVERGIVRENSFLYAVVTNNLVRSYNRADDSNTAAMRAWAAWLYWDVPTECWGSVEKVESWIARGGMGESDFPRLAGLHVEEGQ